MVRPRNWCPEMCRKLRFLGPQSWAVWGVQNRNFWTFPDMSGKTPKVPIFWDFRKSAEIHKNRQNRRNRTFLPKSWKLAIFGTLGTTLRIWPETRKSARIEVLAGLARKSKNWSGHQKMPIFEVPKKCKKMRKFPEILTPKKSEKKCCTSRERRVANGGEFRPARSKKWHFFEDF